MIENAMRYISGTSLALDCGAGIGRVTKEVLLPTFENVDLLEQSKVQITEAKKQVPKVREFIETKLQNFVFTERYDCIWLQWFLMYVNDKDLLNFLVKARKTGLKAIRHSSTMKTGLIFIKENVSVSESPVYSKEDCSKTRTAQ